MPAYIILTHQVRSFLNPGLSEPVTEIPTLGVIISPGNPTPGCSSQNSTILFKAEICFQCPTAPVEYQFIISSVSAGGRNKA